MDVTDVALRLGCAMAVGCALGLNRDRKQKPAGVRTLGLVGLGSAIAVLVIAEQNDVNATSRVIQGLLTGIGFVCAGVIVHGSMGNQVTGLTTATCAWLTACLGAACGAGQWLIIAVSIPLVFLVLLLGGPFERFLHPRGGEADE